MNEAGSARDTADGMIDPKRPWITDPREAPAAMSWVETLTNPFGTTSRVHFTRAWTGLFFFRVIYFFGTAATAAVFAAAGGSFSLPNWVWPLLVVITAGLSLVLHIRRLADARRSPLWALLVALPIIIGAAGFVGGVAMGGGQYSQIVDQQMAREAPVVPAETTEQAGTDAAPATEATAEEAEEGGEAAERRGPPGPQIDVTEVSQRQHALNSGLGMAQMVWAPVSFFVMLWSLLWVGRLPTGGGTIRSRFEDQAI